MEAQSSDIEFWSNSEIQIRVPSNEETTGKPAATGYIAVQTIDGDIATTGPPNENPQTLIVRYAVLNVRVPGTNEAETVYFADSDSGDGNEDGRLLFTTDASVSPEGVSLIQQALCDWNDVTETQWALGAGLVVPATSSDNDQMNLIYFADASEFFMNPEATAFTKITGSRLVTCNVTQEWYRNQVDIIFREDLTTINPPATGGWFYDDFFNPQNNQIDFYSAILHELGHAHLLKHTIPNNTVMWYALPQGETSRIIDGNNADGASYILQESIDQLGDSDFCPAAVGMGSCTSPTSTHEVHEHSLDIYPNPSSNTVVLEAGHLLGEISKIQVVDVLGRVVYNKSSDTSGQKINLQLSNIHAGHYTILIYTTDGNLISEKIIRL